MINHYVQLIKAFASDTRDAGHTRVTFKNKGILVAFLPGSWYSGVSIRNVWTRCKIPVTE